MRECYSACAYNKKRLTLGSQLSLIGEIREAYVKRATIVKKKTGEEKKLHATYLKTKRGRESAKIQGGEN